MDIEIIKQEYSNLLEQLSDPELISDWGKFEELKKRKDFLEKIISTKQELEEVEKRIKENEVIISGGEDRDLVFLAEGEIPELIEKKEKLEEEFKNLFKVSEQKSEEKESGAIIIEIRAGAGGDEAAFFAGDLHRMYSRYADKQNWKQKVLNSSSTEIGGYKEIIFELSASHSKYKNIFSKMKNEGGVHRVQRIPLTEKLGRTHTSTVSVAVLSKPKKTEMKIRPDELKIDFYRSSGPGGQNVNKRETAVRITHLPTGIVVSSQNERNQLQNKENAMSILEVKILEKKHIEAEETFLGKRNAQIGKAQRVEKIRTYNFPQNRVTDHRIKKSWHDIEAVINGDIDQILKSFENYSSKE